MGVNLRRAEAFVTEKFLHDTKICSTIEQVRRKGVAECVRVKCLRKARTTRYIVQSCASAALAQWPAVAI